MWLKIQKNEAMKRTDNASCVALTLTSCFTLLRHSSLFIVLASTLENTLPPMNPKPACVLVLEWWLRSTTWRSKKEISSHHKQTNTERKLTPYRRQSYDDWSQCFMLLHASSLLLVMCMMNEAVSSMVRGATRPSFVCVLFSVCMLKKDEARWRKRKRVRLCVSYVYSVLCNIVTHIL